jgi:hypothetical protein
MHSLSFDDHTVNIRVKEKREEAGGEKKKKRSPRYTLSVTEDVRQQPFSSSHSLFFDASLAEET